MNRKIIFVPPEDSHYTGIFCGICYVEGKQVTKREFRQEILKRSLEKNQTLTAEKPGD